MGHIPGFRMRRVQQIVEIDWEESVGTASKAAVSTSIQASPQPGFKVTDAVAGQYSRSAAASLYSLLKMSAAYHGCR